MAPPLAAGSGMYLNLNFLSGRPNRTCCRECAKRDDCPVEGAGRRRTRDFATRASSSTTFACTARSPERAWRIAPAIAVRYPGKGES